MKYKQQLYFIISFLSLRVLILVLYVFFEPAQSGRYTPYIVFLYSVFDVLILFFLYRFVKKMKQQPFSVIAVLMIVFSITYSLIVELCFPFETSNLSLAEIQLLTIPAHILTIVGRVTHLIQLLKNNAADSSKKYLRMLGWSYVATLLVGLASPFLYAILDYVPNFPIHLIHLAVVLPWIMMIMLYLNELKQNAHPKAYSDSPSIDSEI